MALDLYFYTFAKVPAVVEEGEWISASSLPTESQICAFTKVVDGPDSIRIFENGGDSESLVFEGCLDDLDSGISDIVLPLLGTSIGDLPPGSESGLRQIIGIQDDADYDLDEEWEYTLGHDEIACPAGVSGRIIVSVAPYYSAEVASPLDVAARPPKLINADESFREGHALVALFLG